jgi:hypothetical protein
MQLDWRLSDDSIGEDTSDDHKDLEYRKTVKCKIFLGCISNLISSGLRETIRFLIEHKMVSICIISQFLYFRTKAIYNVYLYNFLIYIVQEVHLFLILVGYMVFNCLS